MKIEHKWLGDVSSWENLNKASDNIEHFVAKFNKATNANRGVL
jgi:hypothetical protein